VERGGGGKGFHLCHSEEAVECFLGRPHRNGGGNFGCRNGAMVEGVGASKEGASAKDGYPQASSNSMLRPAAI